MSESAARLREIRLTDFRNFEQLELAVPPTGFVLVGDNGQGKTNLLEAIYYVQVFRSARGARDADLVRHGADAFHIFAEVRRDDWREIGIGFERSSQRKRVRVDGNVIERLAATIGALPCVMFSPDDVALVVGAPTTRRRFLDIMLALASPGYLTALQQYRTALAHRNAALRALSRHGDADLASITIWEAPLVRHGAVLVEARRDWVASQAPRFAEWCADIGAGEQLGLAYAETIAPYAKATDALESALQTKRTLDVRRGFTHAGPHRDDLHLTIGGRELKTFGSAGQQRTAAIVMRMLEAATLADSVGGQLLLLLDDPFAELDQARAQRVLGALTRRGLGQTILTVPKPSDVPRELTALPRFRIASGTITANHP